MITTMTMIMRFKSSLIMCFLLLGVTWRDFVRGDVTLAAYFHKCKLRENSMEWARELGQQCKLNRVNSRLICDDLRPGESNSDQVEAVGNVCSHDQYYDEHLEICSPCKEVCPTIPCPICPHFVLNPEPLLRTKAERGTVDDATRAFWIVLGITIFLLVCIVGAIIIWQRQNLIKMCKKKTRPREVQAEMETQQPLQCHNSTLVV